MLLAKKKFAAYYLSFSQVVYKTARDGTTPGPPPKKKHCPLPNFGLSNELLHVVLASLCILSPSAQFCCRTIKQRRNLQLTFRSHFSESISFERLAPRFRCASCPFLLGKKIIAHWKRAKQPFPECPFQ